MSTNGSQKKNQQAATAFCIICPAVFVSMAAGCLSDISLARSLCKNGIPLDNSWQAMAHIQYSTCNKVCPSKSPSVYKPWKSYA
eukprot:2587997-Amphidinium_carterae.1